MASLTSSVQPQHSDPIRIVPLHLPPELEVAPLAPARLTYRGGPLLTQVNVFNLYWGLAWQTGQPKAASTYLDQFFTYISTSPLIDQLGEYSVPGKTIGHGKFSGSAVITSPAPGPTTTDSAIRSFVQQETTGNPQVPKPNPNNLYFVYLPPGTSVSQGGSRSCQAFCGYHDAIDGQLFYAVMPYPNCNGCRGGLSVNDALTSTSSHELCEAITDPVPGSGWYDDANGEIGDICAWKTKQVGTYTVQMEWSNSAAKCL
jgi:hypothetical protein